MLRFFFIALLLLVLLLLGGPALLLVAAIQPQPLVIEAGGIRTIARIADQEEKQVTANRLCKNSRKPTSA